MKRLLSLVLVGVMAFSLCACGENGGSASSDGGSQTSVDNTKNENSKVLKKKKLEYTDDDFINSKAYCYLDGNTLHITNKSIEGKTFELFSTLFKTNYSLIIGEKEKDIYEAHPDLFSVKFHSKTDVQNLYELDCLFRNDIEKIVIDDKIIINALGFSLNNLKTIENIDKIITKGLSFNECYNIENIIGIENLNTSYIDSMYGMFCYCSSLNNLNLSKWDVSNVTNMNEMFYGCTNLSKIDVSKWDVSNVTNMDLMFEGCDSLEEIDISKWKLNENLSSNSFFDGKNINGN